jgi:hypothetical protein
MRRIVLLMALVVLLVAQPAAAQFIEYIQLFPVVARGPGMGGTLWVTDLAVTNPTTAQVVVGIAYFPSGQDNLFNPLFPNRIVLEAGQTVLVEDVLLNTFGVSDASKGMLIMLTDPEFIPSNPEDAEIIAVTRTYNVGSPEGTFGQTIPSLVTAINVGWSSSWITGARNDDLFRSNLGIGNTSVFSQIRVHYRIRASTGIVLAEGSKVIRVASMDQWSLASLGVGTVQGPLSVELWLDEANVGLDPCEEDIPVSFVAYISKVDNGTGDAEYLMAAPFVPYICEASAPD